jgi:hypothetical protein
LEISQKNDEGRRNEQVSEREREGERGRKFYRRVPYRIVGNPADGSNVGRRLAVGLHVLQIRPPHLHQAPPHPPMLLLLLLLNIENKYCKVYDLPSCSNKDVDDDILSHL